MKIYLIWLILAMLVGFTAAQSVVDYRLQKDIELLQKRFDESHQQTIYSYQSYQKLIQHWLSFEKKFNETLENSSNQGNNHQR